MSSAKKNTKRDSTPQRFEKASSSKKSGSFKKGRKNRDDFEDDDGSFDGKDDQLYRSDKQQPGKRSNLLNGVDEDDDGLPDDFDDEVEGEIIDDEEGEYPPIGAGVIYGPDPDAEDEIKPDESQRPRILGFDNKSSAPDLALIHLKIDEILKTLAKFKERREDERSRQSYLDELADNFCTCYGYNRELIDLFMTLFNPAECHQFLEANEKPRPSTIRTNTLKTNRKFLAQILMQRGVSLEPLADWSKVGIKIFESKVPIGATPEYLAGHYMLQSASSFLPVIALAPQVNERVLDMSAAPGGKTTYISQLMKNTGAVVANDSSADRLKALKFNLQRLGVTNCIVCNYDGRKFPKVMKGFDRVLLDAPCTGLGIIAKDQSIKTQRLYIDVKKMSHLQKELILAAIDCCKPGGYVVYSTCSVTVEENEWVVDYALRNRHVKLVDTGLEVGEEGLTKYVEKRFNPSLKLSRRIYPHTHNMDGFYVAKLKKIENGKKTLVKDEETKTEEPKAEKKTENASKNDTPKKASKSEDKSAKKSSSTMKEKINNKIKSKGEKKVQVTEPEAEIEEDNNASENVEVATPQKNKQQKNKKEGSSQKPVQTPPASNQKHERANSSSEKKKKERVDSEEKIQKKIKGSSEKKK